jgi:hypothetical protein
MGERKEPVSSPSKAVLCFPRGSFPLDLDLVCRHLETRRILRQGVLGYLGCSLRLIATLTSESGLIAPHQPCKLGDRECGSEYLCMCKRRCVEGSLDLEWTVVQKMCASLDGGEHPVLNGSSCTWSWFSRSIYIT